MLKKITHVIVKK